jgi:hypothetical protein
VVLTLHCFGCLKHFSASVCFVLQHLLLYIVLGDLDIAPHGMAVFPVSLAALGIVLHGVAH